MKEHKLSNKKWQKSTCFEVPPYPLDLAKFKQQDSEIYQQNIPSRTDYLLSKSSDLIRVSQELIATSQEMILLSEQLITISLMLKENSLMLRSWRERSKAKSRLGRPVRVKSVISD